MTREEAIAFLQGRIDLIDKYYPDIEDYREALDMAIRSLEMQKKLAEFRGMDICKWVEDYDYDEANTSEYEFEASVDDFLIDEEED